MSVPVDLLPADHVLTPAERRIFGKNAIRMGRLHDHFRVEFNDIYRFCDAPERLAMNKNTFVEHAAGLSSHLHSHHGFEERFLFPLWGQRMPQFNMKQEGKHALQHDEIHDGLERFDALLAEFKKTGQYDPNRLREVMDSFKTVLFEHLDEEVKSLSAESMRRYWTLEEMKAMHA